MVNPKLSTAKAWANQKVARWNFIAHLCEVFGSRTWTLIQDAGVHGGVHAKPEVNNSLFYRYNIHYQIVTILQR